LDFLDNGGTGKTGTKIKKTPNMNGVPKIMWKIHVGPQTLKKHNLYNLGPWKFKQN